MSWGVSKVFKADTAATELVGLRWDYDLGDHELPSREQILAAKDAARTLLRHGVPGNYPYVMVSLSGHGNPGHEHVEGWANDSVGVTITGVTQENYERYYQA